MVSPLLDRQRFGEGPGPVQDFGSWAVEPHDVVPAGADRQAVGLVVAAAELDAYRAVGISCFRRGQSRLRRPAFGNVPERGVSACRGAPSLVRVVATASVTSITIAQPGPSSASLALSHSFDDTTSGRAITASLRTGPLG
jgi:hypothetical protein